jgi:hypothetical protein
VGDTDGSSHSKRSQIQYHLGLVSDGFFIRLVRNQISSEPDRVGIR